MRIDEMESIVWKNGDGNDLSKGQIIANLIEEFDNVKYFINVCKETYGNETTDRMTDDMSWDQVVDLFLEMY